MFDKLGSFKSYSISKIPSSVELYYIFCLQPNMLVNMIDLLFKNTYLCDKLENVDNKSYDWKNISNKTISLSAILALVIIETIVITFYNGTYNAILTLNFGNNWFFKLFCVRILAFSFAIICCDIRKYQSGVKVVKFFNGRIRQSMYYHI